MKFPANHNPFVGRIVHYVAGDQCIPAVILEVLPQDITPPIVVLCPIFETEKVEARYGSSNGNWHYRDV